MSSKNKTSNVVAAIASFLLPGLGQLAQGRIAHAAMYFFLAIGLWIVFLGWIMNLVSAFDAAVYDEKRD